MEKRLEKYHEARAFAQKALDAGLKYPDGSPMVRRLEESVQAYAGPPDIFDCPDDCSQCDKHFRRFVEQTTDSRMYTSQLTDKEAQVIANDFTRVIFGTLTNVREKLETHGNVIFNRWNKKTREQRESLVLEVAPDMFKAKAPQAYLSNTKNGWELQRRYRTTYLLPYLTVDNLCDDTLKLFGLLHARSVSEPEEWVMFDSEQMNTGFARGPLSLTFNPHSVVLHGRHYGKLVDWDSEDAHSWNTIGWPRAHLILEAQATLMQFLSDMVQKLLGTHDCSAGSDKWKKLIAVGFKAPGGLEFWSSYNRQAFLAAPTFDPINLLEAAKSRYAAAEDEMELLQTDPEYFLTQAKKVLKLDVINYLGKFDVVQKWCAVFFEQVNAPKRCARDWRFIAQELTSVCELHQKYASSVKVGSKMPKEYGLLLGSLQMLLTNVYRRRIGDLHETLGRLPGFQHHYEKDDDDGGYHLKHTSRDIDKLFAEDPLFWAMIRLSAYGTDYVEMNRAFYLTFIDDHLSGCTPQEKARIDQRTYACLAELSGLDTILLQLQQMRPFSVPVSYQVAVETQSERSGKLGAWRNFIVPVPQISVKSCKPVANAVKAFVEQGWPKGKKDQRWLQQADRSRELLSNIWAAYEVIFYESIGESDRTPEEIGYQRSLLRFAHHPSHLAKLEEERKEILQPRPIPSPTATTAAQGLSTSLHSQLPGPSLKSEIIRNAKIQLEKGQKSKSESSQPLKLSAAENKTMTLSSVGASDLVASIEVGPATLRVFKSMFSVDTDAVGTVRWPQFVAAMVDTGCSATQSSGSAVTFKHDQYGTIVLHRPHPDPTIDPIMLRINGTRLKKRFGWCKEVFVERKKREA